MTAPGTSPADVGRQLAARREDLDLTQNELAGRIGISARTVSAVERGANQITKSRRGDWEAALELQPGTISRAYRTGSPIEAAEPAPSAPSAPDTPASVDPLAGLPSDPDARLRELIRRTRALGEEMERITGAVPVAGDERRERAK